MQFQSLTIKEDHTGTRLDQALATLLDISRNQAEQLIENGKVKLNGKKPKKTGMKLKEEDHIEYQLEQEKITHLKAENIPLNIIFEDENLLVINKDPGIVVHPDDTGHNSGTIANAALYHCKNLSEGSSMLRPGIVHRLDKDTSGVLLIAKNNKTHQNYAQAFQERKAEKTYIALVSGHLKTKTGRIEAAIKRDHKNRKQMAINPQGKNAITSFEVLEEFPECSLLKVNIETGRTHQIRLHLASIGHPVIGDEVYGEEKINKQFKKRYNLYRQFLHAQNLKIKRKNFTAPLAEDLEETLSKLRN